jgi:D-sedoheptulose 7-phosphate isomerase
MLYEAAGPPDRGEHVLRSVRSKLDQSAAVTVAALEANDDQLDRAAKLIRTAPVVFTAGNGGSATDAADVAELLGRQAHCLSADMATFSALANDIGPEVVFSRPLQSLGRRGDVVLALSTSGTSRNVIEAVQTGARGGLGTIGLAGYGGGRLAELGLGSLLAVDSDSVHRIQEAQVALYSEAVLRARTGRSSAGAGLIPTGRPGRGKRPPSPGPG